MKPDFVANVMFSILFGMLAVPFIAIGIQGLKTRRPFLTSMRLPFLMMVVYCISLLIQFLFFSFSEPILALRWTPLLLCACSLLMLCFATKGYMAFGVTYTPFRQGLLTTLEKLQFSYEEPSSLRRLHSPPSRRAIQLKSGEAELQASMWMGAIHLKLKQSQHYPLLREIANAMNEHFRTSPARTNITSFAFDLIVALLLLAIGVMFLLSSFSRFLVSGHNTSLAMF